MSHDTNFNGLRGCWTTQHQRCPLKSRLTSLLRSVTVLDMTKLNRNDAEAPPGMARNSYGMFVPIGNVKICGREIARSRLQDLIVNWREGGLGNLWVKSIKVVGKGGVYVAPFTGGHLLVVTHDWQSHLFDINESRLIQALQDVWQRGDKKRLQHLLDFISGDDDAITASVLMQIAVFGDLVYS